MIFVAFVYVCIGLIVYDMFRTIIFDRQEWKVILEIMLAAGMTVEEIDIILFVLSLLWPVVILYNILYGK